MSYRPSLLPPRFPFSPVDGPLCAFLSLCVSPILLPPHPPHAPSSPFTESLGLPAEALPGGRPGAPAGTVLSAPKPHSVPGVRG